MPATFSPLRLTWAAEVDQVAGEAHPAASGAAGGHRGEAGADRADRWNAGSGLARNRSGADAEHLAAAAASRVAWRSRCWPARLRLRCCCLGRVHFLWRGWETGRDAGQQRLQTRRQTGRGLATRSCGGRKLQGADPRQHPTEASQSLGCRISRLGPPAAPSPHPTRPPQDRPRRGQPRGAGVRGPERGTGRTPRRGTAAGPGGLRGPGPGGRRATARGRGPGSPPGAARPGGPPRPGPCARRRASRTRAAPRAPPAPARPHQG